MARIKLSEFRIKTILGTVFGVDYPGVEVAKHDPNWSKALEPLSEAQKYVVKVDQAVKGRFKKGLVLLDRSKSDLIGDINSLFEKGYDYVLVEPYFTHEAIEERYFALERTRGGLELTYSTYGGIEVESHAESLTKKYFDHQGIDELQISAEQLEKLIAAFDENYLGFLEINPLLVRADGLAFLDAAAEVDGEAESLVTTWGRPDVRTATTRVLKPQELAAKELNDNSQASFALESINADGAIFLLLSGGGASVVVADEVHNLGYGKQLGNYGEYSGNPNAEETEYYTRQVIELMLNSKAPSKRLIIGGGVANFTDIGKTFTGIIKAFRQYQDQIATQDIAVYVRRGGPHEKAGLKAMDDYLESAHIKHEVHSPDLILGDIVRRALEGVSK